MQRKVARLNQRGLRFDWLVFDEGYGAVVPFLRFLNLAGQRFVAEVPVNFQVKKRMGGMAHRVDARLTGSDARRGRRYRLKHQTVKDSVWRVREATVWVGKEKHRLMVAINEATAELKYFLTNAIEEAPERVLKVAFRRWTVEQVFRLGKQEAGLMHFEGRDYLGLVRHLVLGLVVLGFVSSHTQSLRGKNPQVTAEQVYRTLNQSCVALFRLRRGVSDMRHVSVVIRYHQRRNGQAMVSHKKRRHKCII